MTLSIGDATLPAANTPGTEVSLVIRCHERRAGGNVAHHHFRGIEPEVGQDPGVRSEPRLDDHGLDGDGAPRDQPDARQRVVLGDELGDLVGHDGYASRGEFLVVVVTGFEVLSEQHDIVGPLPPHERLMDTEWTPDDSDGVVTDFPAVAVRAVQHVPTPAFGQTGDVGQFVREAGGDQQPARVELCAARQGDDERPAGPRDVGNRALANLGAVRGRFLTPLLQQFERGMPSRPR